MANPNKTVAAARRRMGGFPNRAPRPVDDFIQWVAEQARAGVTFNSVEQATEAFQAEVASRENV